jgi:hypothetical protein
MRKDQWRKLALPSSGSMKQQNPHNYFQELERSAQELFELGLVAVPAMEATVSRDDYTGFNDFENWRYSDYPGCEEPDQFGLQGEEICGSWNSDKSEFVGFFPVRVHGDGSWTIISKFHERNAEQVRNEIALARKFNIALGLAAKTRINAFMSTPDEFIPNALIRGNLDALNKIGITATQNRIETDGRSFWAYAHVNQSSDNIRHSFRKGKEKFFRFVGGDKPIGKIHIITFIQPCYPSVVFGTKVRMVNSTNKTIIAVINSASESGLDLDFDDDLYEDEFFESWEAEDDEHLDAYEEEDEVLHWSCDPDEDERMFNETVNLYERLQGFDKSIIRHGKGGSVPKPEMAKINAGLNHINVPEMQQIYESTQVEQKIACNPLNLYTKEVSSEQPEHSWLDQLFPPDLAEACRCLTKNLPYDEFSVSVAYLAGIASLLRLGTKINGNPLTKFLVPLNLYVAFIGKSGAKKTPLKGLMVDDPAHPIQLELNRQYTRQLRKWEEDCRGIKGNDKPPKPVPLKIRTQDYSAEGLVSALQKADEQGHSFGIFRDELNGLFKNMNRYTKGNGGDEEQLLELYDGKPFDSTRIANSRSYERCSVTIYGNLQPSVFNNLTKDPDATGQWARFLFVPLPEKTVPLPIECTKHEQREVAAATKVLEDYARSTFELSPCNYILDLESRRLFSEYEHEKQIGVHTSSGETQSALHGKSAGKVLRIAGLIHILNIINKKVLNNETIDVEVLKTAIALVDNCDHWALSQYTSRNVSTNSMITKEMRRLHDLAWKLQGIVSWTHVKGRLSSKEKKLINPIKAEEIFRRLEGIGYGKVSLGIRDGLCYNALKPLPVE